MNGLLWESKLQKHSNYLLTTSGQVVIGSMNDDLNNGPFGNQTNPHDLNTALVCNSDPRCILNLDV